MIVLVCGGRDYKDRGAVYRELDELQPTCVISGAARGADTFAKDWAILNKVNLILVPAKWDKYGKSAGYKRNVEMLTFNPDRVVAFPGGKGTDMMVSLSHKEGVFVQDLRNI